jgi:ATP-binding cassette subfamily B protein
MFFLNHDLLIIDFKKKWWHLLWLQKKSFFFVMFGEVIINVFETLTPVILGALFTYRRYDYFIYFTALWFFMIIFQDFTRKVTTSFSLRCVHSIHFNAHEYFLTVDPAYHAHRESGAILAKIDRAARGYEYFIDAVLIDILGYMAGIITALITLLQESFVLALVLFLLLFFIFLLNTKLSQFFIIPLEHYLIRADDAVKTTSQENLAQVNLIRSYFASNEISLQLYEDDKNLFLQERSLGYANITMWSSIKIMYLATVFILGTYLLREINIGSISVISGISLIVMYIQGTYGIISIERPIRVALKSFTRIKDLFSFIPSFGKQTFPVLQESSVVALPPVFTQGISIAARDISFWYSKSTKIFDHQNFILEIPEDQPNKLYGIIGPSGVGKSTLISILGGQLKPLTGSVRINNIDIYQVNDTIRKSLIALQGQVATSMRGDLKYNLLFGLPEGQTAYNDEYLINLLHRVGLWQIFKDKKGLQTPVGEGGLTLSGGQRQRLNFASLYLRASYYKPHVILIDEPTSSLDEVSEQAITDMMIELAHKALTLIIAHRIKTIQTAVGILDFSLIAREKNMRLYTQQELLETSFYYQQLMRGKISLED